jgi:TetR/AcrR family transcriptional repressor of nem operon
MKKGIETKERIVHKALNLFHEKGYNLTSMNDIVDLTGVKKGNLYFHYNSKEELAVEVLKEALREYDAFITSRISGITPLERLISMINAIAAYHVENGNGRGCIFGNMALESKENSSALSEFVESVFTQWESNISNLLKKSINAGELPELDSTERYARVIISQLEGAVMLSRLHSGYESLRDSVEMIIATLKRKKEEVCNADKRGD